MTTRLLGCVLLLVGQMGVAGTDGVRPAGAAGHLTRLPQQSTAPATTSPTATTPPTATVPPTATAPAATATEPATAPPTSVPPASPPASATVAALTPTTVAATATHPPGTTVTSTAPAIATETAPAGAEPAGRPILVLRGSRVSPGVPVPGQEVSVRLDVRNVGAVDAENVRLSVASTVFRAVGRGASLYKEEIDAGETRPFEVRLLVDSGAPDGVHALDISLHWEDAAGNAYADQTSLGIRVSAPTAARPQLTVTDSRVPASAVPGATFEIVLTVRNGGGRPARDVLLTTAGGPLAPRGASPPRDVMPGQEVSFSLRVVAPSGAEPGALTQVLDLRYHDDDGVPYVDGFPIGLVITGEAALGPLPLVTAYAFGEPLQPGQAFELVLQVENVGARDALRTRMILGGGLTAGGDTAGSSGLGVFAPLDTSNVRFLGRLAAGSSREVRQRMVVNGNAKPGVYVLDVGFEFSDPEGRARGSSAAVTLLVARAVRLQVNAIDVVTRTVVGQGQLFGVELVNAGDASVSVGNIEVHGGAAIDVADGTTFVGTLDAGGFFPLDATLTGRRAGRATVTVVVSYVDDFGRERTLERAFPFEVDPAPDGALETPAPPSASSASLVWRVLRGLLGLGASAPLPSVKERAPEAGHGVQLRRAAPPSSAAAEVTAAPASAGEGAP